MVLFLSVSISHPAQTREFPRSELELFEAGSERLKARAASGQFARESEQLWYSRSLGSSPRIAHLFNLDCQLDGPIRIPSIRQ